MNCHQSGNDISINIVLLGECSMNKFFSPALAIDLGTANTLVYMKDKGVILREPSVVAVKSNRRDVLAVGAEAKRMIGRTPGSIIAVKPLKNGVIADYDTTEIMLKYFIKKASMNKMPFHINPKVLVCVPCGITEVEKKAVEEATRSAGAREAYLLEEPMAAAIGAGLSVNDAKGSLIVDIGGGTTEVAVISLGGIVHAKSLRIGGNHMDEAIVEQIRENHNMVIGETSAEQIKMKIGTIFDTGENEEMEIRGRNLIHGMPCSLMITTEQVRQALMEPCNKIILAIKQVLEQTPPELSADILKQGITLSGGGSMLPGLNRLVARETGMPVMVCENPCDAVAIGAGLSLEHLNQNKTAFSFSMQEEY
jgi:rod shape-determining protein MreB and related proteins